MALGIYYAPNEDSQYTSLNPFAVTFDGRVGGSQDWLVYIRNNDDTRYYTGISLNATVSSGSDLTNNSVDGYIWKLMEKDIEPNDMEWNDIDPSNTISFSSNLGSSTAADTYTYLPVWIRVTVPDNQLIQSFNNVVLRISAQENLV